MDSNRNKFDKECKRLSTIDIDKKPPFNLDRLVPHFWI